MSRGRPQYDPGPPCMVCGKAQINVDHDNPETRARGIETWAAPSPSMNWQDYYTWAGSVYHAFQPSASGPPQRTDYERGYQAGYHAAIRGKAAR